VREQNLSYFIQYGGTLDPLREALHVAPIPMLFATLPTAICFPNSKQLSDCSKSEEEGCAWERAEEIYNEPITAAAEIKGKSIIGLKVL